MEVVYLELECHWAKVWKRDQQVEEGYPDGDFHPKMEEEGEQEVVLRTK